MGWDVNEHVYDLKEKKTFKDVIDMKTAKKPELVRVKNDISGQVVYSEKGSNVVVTAYDTQEVTYKKVSTTISSEKETTGKNKGKYKVTTITYNAKFDGNGKVDGYDDGTITTTYSKKAGTGEEEIVYQTVNSKNKVIATSDVDVEGQNKIIVNKDKVLGTVTCKNGESSEYDLYADSADFDGNLFTTLWYAPQKSGKKYTGTWLQEDATSTSANETFNLGVNRDDLAPDDINYDMELAGGHGKDTIVLSKGTRLNVELENDVDMVRTFSKSKNNIILKVGATANYDSSEYTKNEMIVSKTAGGYQILYNTYKWQEVGEDEYDWVLVSGSEPVDYTPAEYKAVYNSLKTYEGVILTIGTNVFYTDEAGNTYTDAAEPLAQVTFKDYLKLAEDGVTIGETSLKDLLENNVKGVSILGDSDAIRNQKLTGTFLKEQFYGGTKNDTITTGNDNDTIYLSGGKDTVTVNGTGIKKFDFDGDSATLGQTTVKFAKGTNFELPQEGALSDGKTALNLANVYNSDDFSFGLVKSGNDLVLDAGAENRAKNIIEGTKDEVPTATLTVSNFFAENGALAGTVFDYDEEDHMEMSLDELNEKEGVMVYQFGSTGKANKMQDTKYDDMLIGGNKADKFTVSNGTTRIVGLKGNDTINVEATATGTVSIGETMGSGNDTLNIDSEVGENVEFMINGAYSKMMTSDKADISFEKTGNDLIFNMTYFKDADAGIKKDINDSLTVKNFFNNEFDIAFGYNNLEPDDWYEVNAALGKYLTVNGVKDTDKASSTYNETIFAGTAYNDKMTYSGSGSAVMLGDDGNDLYEIKLTKNKADLYLYDALGKNEVVLGAGASDYRLLFNADKNGVVTDDTEGGMDSLLIFDSKSLTMSNIANVFKGKASGSVEIDDYFDSEPILGKGTYTFKVTEKAGTESFDMSDYIDQVTENVQAWFTAEGNKYADSTAIEVLNSGDKTAISELIACYNVQYSNPS